MKFRDFLLNESKASTLNEDAFVEKTKAFFNKISACLGKKTLEDVNRELALIKKEYGDKPSAENMSDISKRIVNVLKKNKNQFDESKLPDNIVNESQLNEGFWEFLKKHDTEAIATIGGGITGLIAGITLGFKSFVVAWAVKGFVAAVLIGMGTCGITVLSGLLLGAIGGIAKAYNDKNDPIKKLKSGESSKRF